MQNKSDLFDKLLTIIKRDCEESFFEKVDEFYKEEHGQRHLDIILQKADGRFSELFEGYDVASNAIGLFYLAQEILEQLQKKKQLFLKYENVGCSGEGDSGVLYMDRDTIDITVSVNKDTLRSDIADTDKSKNALLSVSINLL